MEKGLKGAVELMNEVTLPEAGVIRFVHLDKDYLGVAQTKASAGCDLPWVCAYLEIEPDGDVDGHGGKAVLLDGNVIGSTVSVAYGHTLGKILAFAYIKPHGAVPGTDLQVVIHGEPRRARVLGAPAYDPNNLRPRDDK
jgi:dimethylglycine dehydrogenase